MLVLLLYALVILPLQVVIWTIRLLPVLIGVAVAGLWLVALGGMLVWRTLRPSRTVQKAPHIDVDADIAWHDQTMLDESARRLSDA